MRVQRLGVRNLRVFETLEIGQFGQFNLIYGPNASGKTSLLEALYLLGTTRSFRTSNILDLLRYGTDTLQITAQILGERGNIPLGLERSRDALTLRAAGQSVHRASELAQWLPVQAIHPESHQLISGGPKNRRRFLDWGVFHVEHTFQGIWRRYDRALRQRNASLKNPLPGTERVWNRELGETAVQIDSLRRNYIDQLERVWPQYIEALSGNESYSMEYHPGWDINQPLEKELERTFERDRKRGFTCSGPHRAELVFRSQGHPAAQQVSRGQQKILVAALYLAQADILARKTGKSCVLLFDDLAAELDRPHRQRLLQVLGGMKAQVFITSVERESIDLTGASDVRMFHVEQGQFREML